MRFADAWSMGWRQVWRRPLESVLIILGIGIGVGVVTSVLLLVTGFGTQVRDVTGHPSLREVRVTAKESDHSAVFDGPVAVAIGPVDQLRVELTLEDVERFRQEIPGLAVAWANRNIGVPITSPPMSHRFSGGGVAISGSGAVMTESSYTVAVEAVEPSLGGSVEETYVAEERSQPEFANDWELHEFYEQNFLQFSGVTYGLIEFLNIPLAQGSWFLPEDIAAGRNVVVLTHQTAQRFFPDEDPIGQILRVDDGRLEFSVVGVMHPLPEEDWNNPIRYFLGLYRGDGGVLPFTATPYGNGDRVDEIKVYPQEGVDMLQFQRNLSDYLQTVYGGAVVASSNIRHMEENQNMLNRVAMIIGGLATAALLVAAINILNLMLARILRMTKRVGISRVLGATRGHVFVQVLSEAVSVGVFGGILGLGISMGARAILVRLLGISLSVSPMVAVTAVGLGMGISLLFGLYPAWEAAKIVPVDALRTE